jgi:conjugative relaxase-like TrwC/TraI family protein
MHKLTAGDGYTYLTRQVAAHDATERGRGALADYYSAKGESPGIWMGSGLAGLPKVSTLNAGERVSEAQMLALFGEGRHPNATEIEERRIKELVADGASMEAASRIALRETKLGNPYRIHTGATEFRQAVAEAFVAQNLAAGRKWSAAIDDDQRARIRTDIAQSMFAKEFGRAPLDERELSGWVAKNSRQKTTAVAGFDVTFSPVKSVSTLWAISPREISEIIEQCHHDASNDAMEWFEKNALFTRLGTDGVQQVEVEGMLAAAFTHRDSRAGEPDLHTHVAISNKVKVAGQDKWLAVDGRPLHKSMVAISETYNTRLEGYLRERLGVEFADRVGTDPTKRPIREIVGVDTRLTERWSSRSAAISTRRGELAAQFQLDHGREPTAGEMRKLAQRANLETREAKHEPRSLAEQRAAWRQEAIEVLGTSHDVSVMVAAASMPRQRTGPVSIDDQWIGACADRALKAVSASRARWQPWHVRAEAARIVRAENVARVDMNEAIDAITNAALDTTRSVRLGPDEDLGEPGPLRRKNGASVYTTEGSQLYTSESMLAAEQRLIDASQQTGGRAVTDLTVDLALLEHAANKFELKSSQAQMVRDLATSGRRVHLALAPAGTGKTTAMAVLRSAWEAEGGTVLGLAPTAAAAAALAKDLSATTDTLNKLTHTLDDLDTASGEPVKVPGWFSSIDDKSLVVIDEAGMASTADLDRVVKFVLDRGGSVRLVGDDQQLASVSSGGVLRDIDATAGSATLTDVVRFKDPAEGNASLALRDGNPEAIGFYIDHGRIHVGDVLSAEDQVYSAWQNDRDNGLDAVMLAPTRETARGLNERARADRIASTGSEFNGPETVLADGLAASAGDIITTRRNDRRLVIGATDFVRNGDRWTVDLVHENGALTVHRQSDGRKLTLPASYVTEHVQLGYARTIHAAQGLTADTCHTIFTGSESRQLLYVALTRGKLGNHAYLASALDGDDHSMITPDALAPPTAVDLLTRILARDGAQESATTAGRRLADPAERLALAAPAYDDAVGTAAENVLGAEALARIDAGAEQLHPGLTEAAAWPVLRKHLATIAVSGDDALAALSAAAKSRELGTAADVAAVLDWRLDHSGNHSRSSGQLPWLPSIPTALADDPTWGSYLTRRSELVQELSDDISARARSWDSDTAPVWARALLDDADLIADLAVWRAARGIADVDLRPTGPEQYAIAHRTHQRRLDRRVEKVVGSPNAAMATWRQLIQKVEPRILADPFWPVLALRLTTARRAGLDVPTLVRSVTADSALPDEMPGAALWWRLSRTLSPAALATGTSGRHLTPSWAHVLDDVLGDDLARRVRDDSAWPALVSAMDAAPLDRTHHEILTFARDAVADAADTDGDDHDALRPTELTRALAWRISALTHHELAHTDIPLTEHTPVDPDEELAAAARAGKNDPYADAEQAPRSTGTDLHPTLPGAEPTPTRELPPLPEPDYYPPLSDADVPPDPDLPPPPDEYDYEPAQLPLDAAHPVAAAPLPEDGYHDLDTHDQLSSLHADLAAARADLTAQEAAVRANRGTYMNAAWPMIREMRERADALRPVYFAAEDAHEAWMTASQELEDLDHRCAEITRSAGQLRDAGNELDALSAEAELSLVEIMREHAQAVQTRARGEYETAREQLEQAAGGPTGIVTSSDVEIARSVAADLDEQALAAARRKVTALGGALVRVETHAAHLAAHDAAADTELPAPQRPVDRGTAATATLPRLDVDQAGPRRGVERPTAVHQPVAPSQDLETAPEREEEQETQAQDEARPQPDRAAVEARVIQGNKAVQMPSAELKSKLKQTMLTQRMNPTDTGQATVDRYRGELTRRAELPRDERAVEDAVRQRLSEQNRRTDRGRSTPDTGPRRDRDRGLDR